MEKVQVILVEPVAVDQLMEMAVHSKLLPEVVSVESVELAVLHSKMVALEQEIHLNVVLIAY